MDGRKTTPRGSLPPDEILESLPTTYARALVLLAGGADDEEISASLGVPPEAVPALIDLARRKAERAMADPRDDGQRLGAEPGTE